MRRDKGFRLVMSATERAMLQRLAESDGDSQAAVLRRLLRTAAKERGCWPSSNMSKAPAAEAVRP